MKIKKITINNFQAHKNTVIDFVDGLNIIVGPSDVGKSAVLRSIQKVLRDIPPGKGFINDNADYAEIILDIDNHIITRKISATKNIYNLDSQEFGGFGRDIPKEIIDIICMPIVVLEDNTTIDLHFSFQHDRPFLISETASIRSKLLGTISGLNVLDKSIIEINKESRSINSQYKIIQQDIEQLKKEHAAIIDTTSHEQILQSLELLISKLKESRKVCDSLTILQKELSQISIVGRDIKQKYEAIPEFNIDFQSIRSKIREYNKLKDLSNSFVDVENRIATLTKQPIPEISVDFSEIKLKLKQLKQAKDLYNNLEEISIKEQDAQTKITKFNENIIEAEKAFIQLLIDLKTCPTCKRSTTDGNLINPLS